MSTARGRRSQTRAGWLRDATVNALAADTPDAPDVVRQITSRSPSKHFNIRTDRWEHRYEVLWHGKKGERVSWELEGELLDARAPQLQSFAQDDEMVRILSVTRIKGVMWYNADILINHPQRGEICVESGLYTLDDFQDRDEISTAAIDCAVEAYDLARALDQEKKRRRANREDNAAKQVKAEQVVQGPRFEREFAHRTESAGVTRCREDPGTKERKGANEAKGRDRLRMQTRSLRQGTIGSKAAQEDSRPASSGRAESKTVGKNAQHVAASRGIKSKAALRVKAEISPHPPKASAICAIIAECQRRRKASGPRSKHYLVEMQTAVKEDIIPPTHWMNRAELNKLCGKQGAQDVMATYEAGKTAAAAAAAGGVVAEDVKTEYEEERQKTIEENREMMIKLGLRTSAT